MLDSRLELRYQDNQASTVAGTLSKKGPKLKLAQPELLIFLNFFTETATLVALMVAIPLQ